MQAEQLKRRLKKDRPMASVTVRIPEDVIESMKAIAPLRGFSGYQTLLKLYLSEGVRRDSALLEPTVNRFVHALLARGVPSEVIEQASQEVLR
jgi:hypothetical protein